ncbi:hypothetical protein K458DRAFT_130918 [Lentithecium fluviatile CBS 122367]|uniref:Uncharacterized protein n=1 Tax=Lentithecium fluviatile CBS 122367 TaxID=1168545 RepID=A0A6G1JGS8_9PLEO|nr:hypothetical protein K458DRAFT_130918 [Lentithecium fluviatile CBS 122367]
MAQYISSSALALAATTPSLSMATHAFFFGSTTFTDRQQTAFLDQQTPTDQDETPTSQQSIAPANRTSSCEQPGSADEDVECFLQRTRRRLSTIKEEPEKEAINKSGVDNKCGTAQRRVSLQKGGWTVPKVEAMAPPIDEQMQSDAVQAHISPPKSPPEVYAISMLQADATTSFIGWDQ